MVFAVTLFSCANKEKGSVRLDNGNNIEIIINDSVYQQLELNRNLALKNGVIDKSLKKYFRATINYKNKETPVKLRLKGDWIDHLKGEKWSFRIKVTGDNSFLGLKSFSIQSPHTRSFLHEWFMHQVYLREGVLTTRYEFVPIMINGKTMGIYALEEHFDKQLVEAKGRREGPLLKFNEEGLWETRVGDPDGYHSLPYFAAAEVVPFKKNRTMKNPVLKQHFKTAQSLLLRYKAFDKNIEEIFDLDKMAKFYALTDLANTDHALIWHNLRFYYNPVSRKLEPIAYDCYPEKVEMSANQPIFGYSKGKAIFPDFNYIHYNLFNNPSFKSLYALYLKEYSEDNYLNDLFLELDSSLNSIGNLLAPEYPDSKLNKAFYYSNVKSIRETLPEFINSSVKYELQDYGFEDFKNTKTYYYHTGLKAYSSPYQDSVSNHVQFKNLHSTSVTIVGYGVKQNKDSIIIMGSPIRIKPLTQNKITHSLNLPKSAKTIFFVPENRLDTLRLSISKWAPNQKFVDSVESLNKKNFIEHSAVTTNPVAKQIVIKKGKHTISNDLIVPKGWTFIIEPGSEIDLTNNAAIVSYSSVCAAGTTSDQIFIHSSDSTGQGLAVIDNYGNSLLRHVTFKNLNTLHKYGWYLTGAVTFYQSNVIIENCTFEYNLCEDAINLVQSNFTFSNSSVRNTYSDGLDSDFCSGTILNSTFKSTGNDCIDLSGSIVDIKGCTVTNAGDKGISGGENSFVKVDDTKINKAKTAIASKDLSTVTVNSVILQNVDYGFVAFQKKPEFGPAKIIVTNAMEGFVNYKNLIDNGSVLINKKGGKADTIVGGVKINVDSLYLEFK
jgi:hypothetical protein